MKDKEILELMRSGDFTIAFHDYSRCSFYKGRHKYDKLPENEDCEFDLHDGFKGYASEIMVLLVKALNGKIDSI